MVIKLFLNVWFNIWCAADCNHTRNIWCNKDCGYSFWLSWIFRRRADRGSRNLTLPSLLIFGRNIIWFKIYSWIWWTFLPFNECLQYWDFICSCQGKWFRIFIFQVEEAYWEFHVEDLESVKLWTIWRWSIYPFYKINVVFAEKFLFFLYWVQYLLWFVWRACYGFQERGINMLFVLGGNGTHAGANAIHNEVVNPLSLY